LAGGGVDAGQPLAVGRLPAAGVQDDRFAASGLHDVDCAADAVGEGRCGWGQAGGLADRHCAGAAQLPPDGHPVAGWLGGDPEQQHDPTDDLMLHSL